MADLSDDLPNKNVNSFASSAAVIGRLFLVTMSAIIMSERLQVRGTDGNFVDYHYVGKITSSWY